MGTFDIVVVNLEEGFGVDPGGISQEDIPVGLPCIGFYSVAPYHHMSVENSMGMLVENPFEKLIIQPTYNNTVESISIIRIIQISK